MFSNTFSKISISIDSKITQVTKNNENSKTMESCEFQRNDLFSNYNNKY
jgi:hypothetical protein